MLTRPDGVNDVAPAASRSRAPCRHVGNIPYLAGEGRHAAWSVGERLAGNERSHIVGSVIKKRRKRMAKKKHRKLLKRTRIQRRRAGK
jgi:hypothetical protein